MTRWILAAVSVAALVAVALLWRDNRALRRQLANRTAPVAAADPWQAAPATTERADGPSPLAGLLGGRKLTGSGPAPRFDGAKETRLERRLRRQDQLATLLGRGADESEEAYRARITPLIEMALGGRRDELEEMRRAAEAAAGVTPKQRAELDAAIASVYDEVLTFTNAAVADGTLTPYERNVAGVLQYAGGLGSILEGAETRVGSILSPQQVETIYGTGFEWGEYLGVRAPWESLTPPPPRPQ